MPNPLITNRTGIVQFNSFDFSFAKLITSDTSTSKKLQTYSECGSKKLKNAYWCCPNKKCSSKIKKTKV
jgi:hypothetical protein